MHIVVCEDDPLYLKSIHEKIIRWSEENGHADTKVQSFSSSEEFLDTWSTGLNCDIIFLDVQFLCEIDGMEVAKQIRMTDTNVPIVFITNFDTYIREGYAVRALRYLSKPVCYNDIAPCLDIAYNQYTLSHNEFLILSTAGKRIAIRYTEILFFEALSPHTVIFKQGDIHPIQLRYRFSDIKQKVPHQLFVPCHRSYIVNLIHVRCVKRTELILSNGARLPVSRLYANMLNDAFDSYYQEGCEYFDVEHI